MQEMPKKNNKKKSFSDTIEDHLMTLVLAYVILVPIAVIIASIFTLMILPIKLD